MASKEALDRLKFIVDKELNTGSKSYEDLQEFWNYKEPLKVIEDLVERDTPKKPLKVNNTKLVYWCSKCDCSSIQRYDKFCQDCGQRLDWS